MTREPKINRETVEDAMTLIGEWSASQAAAETGGCDLATQDGQRLFREALNTCAALANVQRQLRRIAECECNGTWPNGVYLGEDGEAELEKRRTRLEAKARALAAPWSVGLLLGGDVRGSQIRLATPKSERSNTWGGASSGWAL